MISQPRLDFDRPAATIATAPPGTRTDACISCGEPLGEDDKREQYCSAACRIWASKKRRAGYLAPRPLPGSPEARRDVGKAVAASNHSHDLVTARRLALRLLSERGTCIISDLRVYAAEKGFALPWHLPWVGSVFQHKWFEPTGERLMAHHRASNARKVNVYRLSAEGRLAVELKPI